MNTSHFPATKHFLHLVLSPNICFVRESNSYRIQTREQRHVPIRCSLYTSRLHGKDFLAFLIFLSPVNSGTSSNYLYLYDLSPFGNPGTWEWGSVDGAWVPLHKAQVFYPSVVSPCTCSHLVRNSCSWRRAVEEKSSLPSPSPPMLHCAG